MNLDDLNPDELSDMWAQQTSPREGLRFMKRRTGELFWTWSGRRAKAFVRQGAWRWARILPGKARKVSPSSPLHTFEELEALVMGLAGEAG